MLKPLINKIGTLLKLVFSWNRVRSPNSTSKAKTNQGHAGSTSGDHSPLHIGDNHHYHGKKERRETISHTNSWKALLKAFSPESAQRFARLINDPKSKDPGKHNLNGHKKWLSQQFENIGLDHSSGGMEFKRAKIVACKAKPNYRVWIRFDDGLEGEVDLHDLVGKGVFQAWESIEFFNRVHVDPKTDTIAWDEEMDLDPYVLREKILKQ